MIVVWEREPLCRPGSTKDVFLRPFLTIICCLKQILVYEKSVLCWRGSLVSPGRDKEELKENLLQSVLTNLPPIYSEEGRDLYLVTVFHFQVNLIFSCYLVFLWGIAGLPSAMKRLRMISMWSVVAPYLTQKEERETWKRIYRTKKDIL